MLQANTSLEESIEAPEMFDCSFYWNKYVVCVCSMFVMIIGLSF